MDLRTQIKNSAKKHPYNDFFKRQGITQVELEGYMGVSEVTICKWLTGRHKIPSHHKNRLHQIVSVLKKQQSYC